MPTTTERDQTTARVGRGSHGPVLVASAALFTASACGARTGLELEPTPRIDAGVDGGRDAGLDAGTDAAIDGGRDGGRDAGPVVAVPELLVVVTADNSYRFGFGDARALRSTFGAAEATEACEIFCCSVACSRDADCAGARCGPLGACEDGRGAEIYRVPEGAVTSADFLYVVAWSDDSVTQGLLVDVRDPSGRPLARSGDPEWSVCAAGRDYDTGSGGPPDDEVSDWLARCDRGEGPSRGWVGSERAGPPRLAIGERNDSAEGTFPLVCGAPGFADTPTSDTRWVWMDTGRGDPFTTPQPEFLIFRIATRDVLP
jgi:hypothetical protein